MYALVGSDLTRTTPQQGLIKLDLVTNTESTWMPEKFEFMAEPTYIPRRRETTSSSASAAEDDGYVAVYLSNGRDLITEFLLFDASDISKGPISRTRLPVFMNTGLHGSYADGAVFEEDDIKRKFKVCTKSIVSLPEEPSSVVIKLLFKYHHVVVSNFPKSLFLTAYMSYLLL